MKITELQVICQIDNPIVDEFKQCHPKQIIGEIIPVPVWKVIYNYITARGNPKTATKYLFLTENS